MAFCPKCKGEMRATDTVCPHCGYDFPAVANASARATRSFPYSPLADLALIAATFAAALGCLITLIAGVMALLNGALLYALVVVPIAFLIQLGSLVVFLRIQDMDKA